MLAKLFRRRIASPVGLFNGAFFDVRTLFVLEHDELPSVSVVTDIDGGRAYAFLQERIGTLAVRTYQHTQFDHDEGKLLFTSTIYVLPGKRMIEIGAKYVEVLHAGDFGFAHGLVKELAAFRAAPREPAIGFARNGSMN
ncbi:MAG: hypothetical protein EOO11_03710 [Chitinophagaceae bacterium]|nr:MAG: hypothetical protein EOO11_03710 [Chitinophagaceae bacterium]